MDIEVAPWLASLPLAPVFHPSEEEFVDPIAYILKIEKEASQFGICKIVPPFSRAAEDTVFSNLNVSLAATQDPIPAFTSAGGIPSVPLSRSMCSAVGDGDARVVVADRNLDSPAKFTTRRQQLGWNPRRPRAGSQYRAQKMVWESGEYYTVEQFEEKAKTFSSALLGSGEEKNPLVVETLFWNAEFAKPISIEYANDIPGSAFIDPSSEAGCSGGLELARSRWNVRNIARSHGSLLKFISNEVPGVTTPMVYLGMLFGWFAWHVEDHKLHSLNYLHAGARKTWYAVPSDAAPALEEFIRLYGYGSRLKPRAAFTRDPGSSGGAMLQGRTGSRGVCHHLSMGVIPGLQPWFQLWRGCRLCDPCMAGAGTRGGGEESFHESPPHAGTRAAPLPFHHVPPKFNSADAAQCDMLPETSALYLRVHGWNLSNATFFYKFFFLFSSGSWRFIIHRSCLQQITKAMEPVVVATIITSSMLVL